MNTEITLPMPELKTALSGLNKLIGRKTTLPVLSCVKVSRQKNGLVSLQATDLDAHATYTLNGTQPGTSLDVLVPIAHLNQAFKCSTGAKQDVVVLCDGKATKLRYHIGGNAVEQPVNSLPVEEWPPLPRITVESAPVAPGFGEALKQAMACCSDNPARQELCGVFLDVRNKDGHYVVASNGHMLFAANSFTFPLTESVIIPDSKFIGGSSLLEVEPCFLSVQPGEKRGGAKHICLQNKHWQFVTREIEGQFPEWKKNLVKLNDQWTRIQLQPPAIEQLLKVIPNLPGVDGNHNPVRLRLKDKVLWIEGRNKDDADWTKIAIAEVAITGQPKEITVNRDFLLPALRFGLNELAVLAELSPMLCRKEGKCLVIMPVNLKGPQTTRPAAFKPGPASAPESPQTTTTTPPASMPAEERKTEMAKTPGPKPEPPKPAETSPSLIDQVETIKEALKNVIRDLTSLVDAVKLAEKEKRASEKEVESARSTLKKLQQVTL